MKWLFNPFVYVAGTRALLVGWGIMLLTVAVSFFSRTQFDGAIDMHTAGHSSSIMVLLIEQLVDWGCVVLLFYPGGLIFSRSYVRFIDVAGTMALARWPMLIAATVGFGLVVPQTDSVDVLIKSITPSMVLLSVVSVLFGIWMIALMYNAFTVACNIKGGRAIGVFIGCLLIAEIASKFILHQIYPLLT